MALVATPHLQVHNSASERSPLLLPHRDVRTVLGAYVSQNIVPFSDLDLSEPVPRYVRVSDLD